MKLEAKPGKERDVAQFLQMGGLLAQQEPKTTAWFALQLGPSTFAIFDAFPDELGRQAHLTGQIAAELMARASDLFVRPPIIEKVDVLKAKLPVPAALQLRTRSAAHPHLVTGTARPSNA